MHIEYRLMQRFERLQGWLTLSSHLRVGPSEVLLEVTSHCNLRCPNCRRSEFITQPAHMDRDLCMGILDKCRNEVEMVFLFGWGEPLLWPHLPHAVERCKALGIVTDITTNAAYPFSEEVRAVMEAGPDLLIIAMDSHIPEIYEKYRLGARFDDVVRTSRELISACRAAGKGTNIVIQMIRWPEMHRKEADFRKFVRALNPDGISVRRCTIADRPESSITKSLRRRSCPILWLGPAYIRADGTVFPCCTLDRFPLGSLHEHTLRELWNNDTMRRLRQLHGSISFDSLPECAGCYHTSDSGYPACYALAGCIFNGRTARRWMYRIDRLLAG